MNSKASNRNDKPKSKPNTVPTGVELIAAERERRIQEGNRSCLKSYEKSEDLHCSDEMAWAACYYAMPEPKTIESVEISPRALFPENWDEFWAQRQGYKDRMHDLVKAGAFIAAEIDRIQRIRNRFSK